MTPFADYASMSARTAEKRRYKIMKTFFESRLAGKKVFILSQKL
jgi:hypothetical protein